MFGLVFGKKKSSEDKNKGGRPSGSRDKTPRKRRSAAEIEQDRFLRDLKEMEPDLYRDIMLKRLGHGDGPGKMDEIDRFLEVQEKIDKFLGPRRRRAAEPEDDSLFGPIAKSFGVGIAKGFKDLMEGQGEAQVTQQPPPRPQLAPVPQPPQAQPQPTPAPAPEEAGMSIESMILTAQFDGATPEGFARWLLAQPQAGELVKLLQQTPDERIPVLLAEVPQRAPKLAGFAAHLRKNPAKFMAVVQILRRLTTAPSADTGPADSEDVGL